ncbi:MAG: nucleotidyltransferase domain-containing protein [Undibacterium sp.]|nr:nucleotidyltransferase domain-containing protein [Opitutaceae bacterium]
MNATATALLSIDELRATVRPVCERHAVLRLDLFGSRAQGTADADSDVDLMVEFLPESNPGLFEMGALQDALEQRLGRRVGLLSRRAVEKSRNVFRRRAILDGPVALYAR